MNLDWMGQGRCAEVDPELFHPERGGSNREAKRVCDRCEVREPCLEYAMNNSVSGIWGGLSEKQRQSLRRAA